MKTGGCTNDFGETEVIAVHPGFGSSKSCIVLSLVPSGVNGGDFATIVCAME